MLFVTVSGYRNITHGFFDIAKFCDEISSLHVLRYVLEKVVFEHQYRKLRTYCQSEYNDCSAIGSHNQNFVTYLKQPNSTKVPSRMFNLLRHR